MASLSPAALRASLCVDLCVKQAVAHDHDPGLRAAWRECAQKFASIAAHRQLDDAQAEAKRARA